jgi:hypothetical protein
MNSIVLFCILSNKALFWVKSEERGNLSILDQERGSLLFEHTGTFYKRNIYKYESSTIAGPMRALLNLSLGNLETLKFPKMSQGKFLQLIKPDNSSHKSLLSLSILGR